MITANNPILYKSIEMPYADALHIATDNLKAAKHKIEALELELEEKVSLRTEELVATNKELESFSYSVSRDLKTPLRSIHGFAAILRDEYGHKLDEGARRLLHRVISSADRMRKLIDNLLIFSRMNKGDMAKSEVSMNDLVRSARAELTCELDRNATPEFQIGQLAQCYANSKSMKQVWLNLIANAMKYSQFKKNAYIEIGSTETMDESIYYIKDNGVGFDMLHAKKLFGVFQRLHPEGEFKGAGVGLAIVHRIITKHHGRIWAEAEVNKGATFYFSLPRVALS